MTEHKLQQDIQLALSEYGHVFRTNAGDFWQGKNIYMPGYGMVIARPRRVIGLPKGFPDLMFIDKDGAAFIEVKTPAGRVSDAQKRFLDILQGYGVRAGVARSVSDALDIIQNGGKK